MNALKIRNYIRKGVEGLLICLIVIGAMSIPLFATGTSLADLLKSPEQRNIEERAENAVIREKTVKSSLERSMSEEYTLSQRVLAKNKEVEHLSREHRAALCDKHVSLFEAKWLQSDTTSLQFHGDGVTKFCDKMPSFIFEKIITRTEYVEVPVVYDEYYEDVLDGLNNHSS